MTFLSHEDEVLTPGKSRVILIPPYHRVERIPQKFRLDVKNGLTEVLFQ